MSDDIELLVADAAAEETSVTITRSGGSFDRRLFAVLSGGAILGSAAVLPYSLTTAGSAIDDAGLSEPQFLAVTFASGLVLPLIAAAVGLLLAPKVGLGAPELQAAIRGRARDGWFSALLPLAVGTGFATGLFTVGVDWALADQLPSVDVGDPSLVVRYAASLYGAVNEELLLRLGLLTLLVWGGTRAVARTTTAPRWVLAAAVVIAAVAFAGLHLPALAAVADLTALVLIRTLALNTALGVAFGWLYVTRGLVAAMVAHLVADLVIQTAAHTLF